MIWCPVCRRYVPLVRKEYRIYCPECGREITYTNKKEEREGENIKSKHTK